jgi:hypothetical protein
MGNRRSLSGGLPRLLAEHRSPEGAQYRRAYQALEAEHGPFRTATLRFAAGRVALLEVSLTASSRALDAARRQRTSGKGRRPSERQLERLARRVGLDDGSYQAALDRLREMAGQQKKTPSIAEYMACKGQHG